MGDVYKAHDAKLDRPVALKLLPADLARDGDRLQRFRAEARAASSLNHPYILVIHDFGDLDGRPFIVSELVDGETLRERLLRGAIPVDEALNIAVQIASALGAAHGRGIVHRDIKPENVMIRPDGYVKVLDFGLAKLMPTPDGDEAETLRTAPGVMLGTPRYMSPEQARGLATDPRTDVWSLGVTLYEMVAGRPPFIGRSTADVIAAIVNSDPAPLDARAPQVPEMLARIVATALAKEPSQRYASAAELHAELTGLRAGIASGLHAIVHASSSAKSTTVGRDKERAELQAALGRATAGRGELLSISGEPGAGKTTLVEDFLNDLTASGTRCRIGRGRCSERLAGAEAYLPVLEALDSLLHAADSQETAQQIATVAPTWYAQVATDGSGTSVRRAAEDPQVSSQERLKREIAALMRELSRAQPLVLFFDDVHWADASTIDLLAYLAPRFADLRMLVITTSRPSDLLLTNHPFLSLRRDLQAKRLCHDVTLDMLTRIDVERYLALEFPGHRFPTELPDLVHAKTEGSPLFMADLVRYLAAKGMLVHDPDGRWVVDGSLSAIGAELPESVRAMIERKIAQLGEDDRLLLTVASIQGYQFDSAVVASVLSQDAADIELRLDALERIHRFVTVVDEREFPDRTLSVRYRFVHVLYQNALYGQLRATRKVTLSRAVAETLVRLHGPRHGEVASELAALFDAARDYLRAAEYYREAAQRATQLFASQEAEVLARRGVSVLHSLPDTRERQERELALRVSLGNALIATRGYASDEVLACYTGAHELCQAIGDTAQLSAVLYGFAAHYVVRAHHPTALRYASQMLALTERQNDPALVVAHRLVGLPLLAMGHLAEARRHFETVAAMYQPAIHRALAFSYGHEPGMASGMNEAMTLWLIGDTEAAVRRRDESLELGRVTPHANSRCYSLHFAAIVDSLRGDRDAVRANAEAALKIAEEQGLALWLGWSALIRGWAVAVDDDMDAGIADMRRGIDASHALGAALFHTYYLSLLAETLARARRCDEAAAVLDEADRLADANEERFWQPELSRLRGELAAVRGDVDEARRLFTRAAATASRQGARSLEQRAHDSLARLSGSPA